MHEKKLDLLEDIFGNCRVQGEEYLFFCPKCEFHKKKLSFNIRKNVFKCWYCDWRGQSIYWAVRTFGDYAQRKTWRQLSGIIDQSDADDDIFAEEVIEIPNIDLPKEFQTLTHKPLDSLARPAYQYLQERNVSDYDVVWWKMGYCSVGDFSNRIIIPSFDMDGKVNYFIARSYRDSWKPYLNPVAPHNFIFNELFLDWRKDIVLVEGVFDAIVAENAIPLLGSTLREDSYTLMRLVQNCKRVYLALDPDAEKERHGASKESRIIDILLKYGLSVMKIDVRPYKDIGEMAKSEFQKRKEKAIEITPDSKLDRMLANL